MENKKNNYDLEERTSKFGENIIDFCKTITQNTITRPLINQLVRSGTSVGANYMEANGASSKKDFRNKIYITKKEIQETAHWLRMIERCIGKTNQSTILLKETSELTLIFGRIIASVNKASV